VSWGQQFISNIQRLSHRLIGLMCLFYCLEVGVVHAVNPNIDIHHYVQKHYGIEQGLPQVSVLDISQDEQGYIWLGTQSGLVRFDGATFKVYGVDNQSIFPSVMVSHLLFDSKNRLWIVTAQGIVIKEKNQFKLYAFDYQKNGQVNDIVELEDGRVIVAANGLFELADSGPKGVFGVTQTIHSILVTERDIWLGGVGRLIQVNLESKREKQFGLSDPQNRITDLAIQNNHIWLGTLKGLYVLKNGQLLDQFERLSNNDPTITRLHSDQENRLWVGTKNMMYRLSDDKTEHISTQNPNSVTWPISFFEDREGNFWVGSRTDGLYKFWDGWARKYSDFEGLKHGFVWSVGSNQDALWLGTNSGLTSYNGQNFEVKVSADQLSDSEVYTLLAEENRILLGTKQGLAVFQNGNVTYPNIFKPLHHAQITVLTKDRFSDLWVGTASGLYQLSEGVLMEYGKRQGIDSDDIRAVYDSTKYGLFVGAMRGLYIKTGERFVVTGPEALRSAFVTAINQTSDGLLVIGTYTKGIFIFDGDKWSQITKDQGLYSNSIFSLLEVENYWWMSSHEGLSRIPMPQLGAFHRGIIGVVDKDIILSLNSNYQGAQKIRCCNGAGSAKGAFFQGALWYPTLDGVVKADPDHIIFNQNKPNVVIEQISFGEENFVLPQELQLSAQTAREVSIKYTALSFQNPENVKFRYRLTGYETQWSEFNNIREATYKNLKPGSYIFEVTASNNHGVWANQTQQLPFYLPPTFRESIWFKLITTMLVLVSIFGLFAIMQVSNKRRQRFLERVIHERTKESEEANFQLKIQNEKLQEISQTDLLTGLKNRYYFEEQIERDIAYFQRHVKTPEGRVMAFILIDIDHFKRINDFYGHKSGDQVLQQFAKILSDFSRHEDYAVRMGGEEFLIVIRDINTDKLDTFVMRLLKAIETARFVAGNAPIQVTASIGYATFPIRMNIQVEQEWSVLLQLADYALYQSKHAGRNAAARMIPNTRELKLHGIYDLKVEIEQLINKGDLRVEGSWCSNQAEEPEDEVASHTGKGHYTGP
jgi:diguanylate cyclase (GGDEF)-like protein